MNGSTHWAFAAIRAAHNDTLISLVSGRGRAADIPKPPSVAVDGAVRAKTECLYPIEERLGRRVFVLGDESKLATPLDGDHAKATGRGVRKEQLDSLTKSARHHCTRRRRIGTRSGARWNAPPTVAVFQVLANTLEWDAPRWRRFDDLHIAAAGTPHWLQMKQIADRSSAQLEIEGWALDNATGSSAGIGKDGVRDIWPDTVLTIGRRNPP